MEETTESSLTIPKNRITIKKPLSIDMINMYSKLGTGINLDKLFEEFPLNDEIITGIKYLGKTKGVVRVSKASKKHKKEFKHQATITMNHNERIIFVKVFATGSLHTPGMKYPEESKEISEVVSKKIAFAFNNKEFGIDINTDKSMYAVGFSIEQNLNRKNLIKKIDEMNITGISTEFNQEKYQGAIIKYPFPNDPNRKSVTLIIHQSGSISIKGSNTQDKIDVVYNFITGVINSNYDSVVIKPKLLLKK